MENNKQESPFSKIKKYIKPYNKSFILSIILAILGVGAGLIPYIIVSKIIIALVNTENHISYYINLCVIAVMAYIIKVIFTNISTSISHGATFKALKDIRKDLIEKISKIPMGIVLDRPSGYFKDVIVDRVESIEVTLAHLLPEMTANILAPLTMILYLFVIDWRMALISLITMPLGFALMKSVMKNYPEKFAGSVEVSKNMNNAIVEYVNGIEVIKAFNQSVNSYKKYSDAVNKDASYFYNWMKSCQWQMAGYTTICPSVLITVLPLGFLFFINGSLSSADFLTVIILSLSIVGPILAATNYLDSVSIAGTVINEVYEVLNLPELIRPEEYVNLKNKDIKLKNVSFAYNKDANEKVLDNINIEIKNNNVVALVGPSGSGKSTITKLINSFWDVSHGKILLGGHNIKDIPLNQLSENIAYVSQDNYLFDDTIRENIRMGKKGALDLEVEKVAKAAGCDKFIRNLEHGYDTKVGGAGGHLSGGERQRIAIARAMLKDAPIVILDEATAYMDPENEAVIQKAVAKLVYGKTLIVVAHRLSTIIDSDQIIVINKGKVAGSGKHEELLKSCKLYKEMWYAHLGVKDGEEDD